jgi:hypothetical protein
MRIIATFLFLAFLPLTAQAETVELPVVLELFTAQGCVSCPPAEKIMHEAAKHPSIIALGCHVTYWDYLGWKDTMAREFCNHRQFSYMPVFNLQNYYTPQMIVNGRHQFIGHDKAKLRDAITDTANHPVLAIPLEKAADGTLTARLPALTTAGSYAVWIFGYKKEHTQDVQAGENEGKTLESANIVVSLDRMSDWDGKAENRTFGLPQNPDVEGIAFLVQEGAYGPVAAAGRLILP